MKENRKLLREVLQDIRRDMTDEEVLNLLADSKISVGPDTEKSKYTLFCLFRHWMADMYYSLFMRL